MTCLGCQLCETGPFKTLIDGRVVCHQCEAWRAECEARTVLRMPTLAQRRKFLADVEKHRGEVAANQLKSDIRKLWDAARPAAGGD
jgi:uncharacterized Zn finger protein (UPF0148 family)